MTIVHVVMAFFAAWRITELINEDVLFGKIRAWWVERFPGKTYRNFLSCPRCVSVWAGVIVTAVFYWFPFSNWPLAFSMVFLIVAPFVTEATKARMRRIVFYPDLQRMEFGQYQVPHGVQLLRQYMAYQDALAQQYEQKQQPQASVLVSAKGAGAASVPANGNR